MTARPAPSITQREIEFSLSLLRIATPGESTDQADELAQLAASVSNVHVIQNR